MRSLEALACFYDFNPFLVILGSELIEDFNRLVGYPARRKRVH